MNFTNVTDLFCKLVSIRSVSGEEAELAAWIAGEFAGDFDSIESDAVGNLRLRKGEKGAGTLFCAHIDTVPHERAVRPVIEGGMVKNAEQEMLGADDKAAVAAMLFALANYHGDQLVELLLTVGEEVDFRGALGVDPEWLLAKKGYIFDTAKPIGTVVTKTPAHYEWELKLRSEQGHAGLSVTNPITEQWLAVNEAFAKIAALPESRFNIGAISGGGALNVIAGELKVAGEFRTREQDSEITFAQLLDGLSGGQTEVSRVKTAHGYSLSEEDWAPLAAVFAQRAIVAQPQESFGLSDVNILRGKDLELINCGNGASGTHSAAETISVADLELLGELVTDLIGS